MINSQKLYDLLTKIPQGKVTTYKELALQLKTKGYRAVGQIVGANPNAPQVPCHRVVRTDGGLGGYAFGIDKKIAILTKEGVKISDGKVVDFEKKLYKF
jgi:methylated-DNA-[protein]-cysteine S-methyltransferase